MQAITNIDPTAMVPSVTPTAWSVPELSSKQIKKMRLCYMYLSEKLHLKL